MWGRAGLIAIAFIAFAQPAEARIRNDVETRLRNHLSAAKKHYGARNWDKAVREWRFAYKLRAIPNIRFNIAQAERQAGHDDEAVAAYTAYLSDVPSTPYRGEIEAHLAMLKRRSGGATTPSASP